MAPGSHGTIGVRCLSEKLINTGTLQARRMRRPLRQTQKALLEPERGPWPVHEIVGGKASEQGAARPHPEMREACEREPACAEQVDQRPRIVTAHMTDDAVVLVPPMCMEWRAQDEPAAGCTHACELATHTDVVADVFQDVEQVQLRNGARREWERVDARTDRPRASTLQLRACRRADIDKQRVGERQPWPQAATNFNLQAIRRVRNVNTRHRYHRCPSPTAFVEAAIVAFDVAQSRNGFHVSPNQRRSAGDHCSPSRLSARATDSPCRPSPHVIHARVFVQLETPAAPEGDPENAAGAVCVEVRLLDAQFHTTVLGAAVVRVVGGYRT